MWEKYLGKKNVQEYMSVFFFSSSLLYHLRTFFGSRSPSLDATQMSGATQQALSSPPSPLRYAPSFSILGRFQLFLPSSTGVESVAKGLWVSVPERRCRQSLDDSNGARFSVSLRRKTTGSPPPHTLLNTAVERTPRCFFTNTCFDGGSIFDLKCFLNDGAP